MSDTSVMRQPDAQPAKAAAEIAGGPPRPLVISVVANLVLVIAVAVLAIELAQPQPPSPPPAPAFSTWLNVNGGKLTVTEGANSVEWQPLSDVTVLERSSTTEAVWRCLILDKRYLSAYRPTSPGVQVITPTGEDVRACGGFPSALSVDDVITR